MEFGQILEQKQQQNLAMTPAQIQKLEILALSNQELIQFLEDEQLENPMLEYESPSASGVDYAVLGEWFRKNDYTSSNDRSVSDEEDVFMEVPEYVQRSFREHLSSQIKSGSVSTALQDVVELLLGYIDENTGFFEEPLEYLQQIAQCGKCEFEEAIAIIRGMEPAGAGAFDLSDCLKLQLWRSGIQDSVLENIIEYYLEDIASGKISHISRSLQISTDKVKYYIRIIKSLNPKPSKGFGLDETVYIIPDIKAVREDGGWEVTLKNSGTDHIRLNGMYMQIAKNATEPELQDYFSEKIKRAKDIMKAIEQRESTIKQVVLFALTHQEGFVQGISKRQRLSMKQAADELNIHPSTVTRAVRDKYIELPTGVCALKELFQAAKTIQDNTDECQQEKMILRIQNTVTQEDKRKPLSDQKISEILEQDGYIAARRTVTKYRELAGIPRAAERRTR